MLTRQTDLVLKEAEKCLCMVLEQVKIGVIIQDTHGSIINVNSALERMLNFTRHELEHKKFIEIVHPDDIQENESIILDLASDLREYYDIEKRLIDKQGQAIWARLVGSLIKTKENSEPFIITLVDNISERKEAEKLKDAFIGIVSHELKNPLMAVISALRMAKKEGQFPEVLHELIEIASDGAESLWVILENLLEVSRARAGRMTILPESSKLSHLVAQTMPGITQTLVHNIQTDIPENLPPVIVDSARIRLVLRNLIDNAIKYSPKGGNILIFSRLTGQEIIVGVKDEGIGISKPDLQNLFKPFERLGMNNILGTGLGLMVCRMLVEGHKGRIWVESESGKGSTFYFTLPLSPEGTSG